MPPKWAIPYFRPLGVNPIVTVIIPTLADTARGALLVRAVRSVLALDVPALAAVVVNGVQADDAVIAAAANAGAIVHRSDSPGVSAARSYGRRRVITPYFGFLDDDDVLLPICGSVRIRPFANAAVDVVVTNGYGASPNGRMAPFCELPANGADAAVALLRSNWLASAAAFYRTATVQADIFENLPNVMELTALGLRLALRHNIHYSHEFTYVIHQDAPNRSSAGGSFFEQAPDVIQQLRQETNRKDLRRRLAQKARAAHHSAVEYYVTHGQFANAWRHHLASLSGAGFWSYAASTRHLLRRQWQALWSERRRAREF